MIFTRINAPTDHLAFNTQGKITGTTIQLLLLLFVLCPVTPGNVGMIAAAAALPPCEVFIGLVALCAGTATCECLLMATVITGVI